MTAHRVHLGYLDGLRAFAALFVVMHHTWQFIVSQPFADQRLPGWFRVFGLFEFGTLGVTIFIVLSGYCLMLPVARTDSGNLPQGVASFLGRRARRILPPYYATVLLTALLILAYPALNRTTVTQWDLALPALTRTSLITHALLIHNLSPDWQWKFNPPLWSVALEWQIYFVFALVLIPIGRRFGTLATIAAALALGLLPLWWSAGFLHTWYIGSFALGMAAATVNFSTRATVRAWRERVPWGGVAALFALPVIVFRVYVEEFPVPDVIVELCLSAATAAFMVDVTRRLGGERPSVAGRALASRWLSGLGAFSYSLYLVHFPLLAVLFLALRPLNLALVPLFGVLSTIGLAVILAVSYAFHCAFERPFMRPAVPDAVKT